ncbi:MAG TPA: MdtA/MuxA family multidrug efflux RND transporter periplasmic adaptor subunit [Dongiaceae bacterium]
MLGCGAALAAGAWLFWSEGQLWSPKSWPQSAEALWSRLTSRDDPPSGTLATAQDPADPQAQTPDSDQDRTTQHRNHQRRGAASRDDGAIPVIVAAAHGGDIPVSLDALGTVTSLAMVTVKPELSGYLTQVAFTEGQMVKRGDFLAQIDPRPYQIALEQAQGQLARDQALLRNANIDLERYKKLVSEDSIARQQVDTQQSLVQQYQGTIVSDQAQIDTAKLNLDYCHITAPVSGRIGLRQVDQGNYVQAAASLAVITQLQPISVVFSIPEDDIPMVQQRLRDGGRLAVTAYDRSRSTKLATGTLATIDNQIDVGTGTVKLRAQFDNDDDALFPNQFVNVALLVDTQHSDTVVPMAAVQHGSAGIYVYLVKPDSTVALQPVQAGSSSGNDVAILSGLASGDQVVIDGVDQLRDGSKVAATQLGDTTGDRMTDTGTPAGNAPQ